MDIPIKVDLAKLIGVGFNVSKDDDENIVLTPTYIRCSKEISSELDDDSTVIEEFEIVLFGEIIRMKLSNGIVIEKEN